MPLENHSLVNEFPEHRNIIHDLKISNRHFSHLFDKYNNVEHEVHRIESGAENTSDKYLEILKKERLKLKDSLYEIILKVA
jgi:hypothetical protein